MVASRTRDASTSFHGSAPMTSFPHPGSSMPARGVTVSLRGNAALTNRQPGLLSTTTIDGSAPIASQRAAARHSGPAAVRPTDRGKEVIAESDPATHRLTQTATATAYRQVHSGVP